MSGAGHGGGASGDETGTGLFEVAPTEDLRNVRAGSDTELAISSTCRALPVPSTPRRLGLRAAAELSLAGGRFELIERIGAGGMGIVYAAFDAQTREKVAAKTLQHLDGSSLYRLKSEFRSLTSVVHP